MHFLDWDQGGDVYYSVALVESTDINDSALFQVLFFIRVITSCYEQQLGFDVLAEITRGNKHFEFVPRKFQ